MTPEQVEHLKSIQRRVNSRLEEKYVRGQLEHGGNLWERDNLQDLGMEIIDMLTYFHCVEDVVLRANQLVRQMEQIVEDDIKYPHDKLNELNPIYKELRKLFPDYDKRTTCCIGLHAPNCDSTSNKTNPSV